jgi:tetratricopeptide (TPR) repeat protein
MGANETSIAPRVFISYSHDSREHEQRVLELANRLRRDGIDCVIDQYFTSPAEGWPRWTAEQVSRAAFVLVVCTEDYWRRFEEKPGVGVGAKWEGSILRQERYEAENRTTHIPVIFSAEDVNYIPLVLKGTTFCRLDLPEGYERLLQRLLGQSVVTKPELRALPLGATQKESESASPAAVPSNLPFPPNPYFVGRHEELEQLHRLLTMKHTAAITRPIAVQGLGGIGKTQLALEYAWKYRAEYKALLWVQGDTPEVLRANFAALAGPHLLNLPEASADDQGVIIKGVLRWLRLNQGWLLILDQADTSEAFQFIRQLQSVSAHGHIIITSRFAHWSPDMPTLSLDALSSDAAVDFLLQHTGAWAGNRAAAARLAARLDFFPLALKLVAANIRNRRSSFEQSLQQLDIGVTRPTASLAAMWLKIREHLDRLGRTILRLSAFMAPSDIPIAMFRMQKAILEALTGADEGAVAPDAATEAAVQKSLEQLAEYSVIALASDSFSVHPLVQAVERETLLEEQRRQCVAFALRILNDYSPTPPNDPRNWRVWDRLYPHADAALIHAQSCGVVNDLAMRLANQVGGYLFSKGMFDKAEPLYRRALTIAETAFGPADSNVVTCLNNLAELLRATSRLAEAEPLCRRALTIAENVFGPDNRNVVTCLNNLAELLRAMARLTEAEPLYRRALAIAEAAFDPDRPDIAVALNNLAGLLSETNRFDEAEPLYYRALRLDEATFGPNHPNVATDLSNLAALFRATNRLGEAEPLYRRAVAIYEEQLGPEHPDTIEGLANLAAVYDAQGKSADAESLYSYVLNAQERALGPENPKLSTTLSNYASLLARDGRLAAAEPLYRRALEIDETALGPMHPTVAVRLNNLASLLSASNRGDEAKALLKNAVDILGRSVGLEHPLARQVIENAASIR